MAKFLLKLFLLDALIFLQFLGNSSSAPCSDNSWIQLPQTTVSQPQSVMDASNVTDCQNMCLSNRSCVGVAWNSNSSRCYFNLDPSNIGINYMNQSATTYYGLMRNYSACDKDNYNCSWVGVKDYHGFEGSEINRHDLVGCVQACQDNASCASVDWNYQEGSCWIFSGIPYTGSLPGIFRFVRNCTGSPPASPKYTPRISTVGPSTTTSTSISTSASATSSSPAGPSTVSSSSTSTSTSTVTSSSTSTSTVASSSTSTSTVASSSTSTSTVASSSTSTSTVASSSTSTSTVASSTRASSSSSAVSSSLGSPSSTSTATNNAAVLSSTSIGAALALEVSSEANDWYPLAIKPAYIVLAGVGGGCILLVITAVVILCEYPLNRSLSASNGTSASKHVHAYQSSQSPDTNYSSDAREENVDMSEMEMELDKTQHGDAEDSQ